MKRLFKDGWDIETITVQSEIINIMKDKAKELCKTYNSFDVENIFHQAVVDLMLDIRLNLKHGDAWKV